MFVQRIQVAVWLPSNLSLRRSRYGILEPWRSGRGKQREFRRDRENLGAMNLSLGTLYLRLFQFRNDQVLRLLTNTSHLSKPTKTHDHGRTRGRRVSTQEDQALRSARQT